MGDVWSVDHLVLFLAFFVPGFIAMQIYGLFVAVDHHDPVKQLPSVIGYSALHYALTGWLFFVIPEGLWRGIAAYIIVLVLPIVWTPLLLLTRDPERWRRVFRHPRFAFDAMFKPEMTPWDRVVTAQTG